MPHVQVGPRTLAWERRGQGEPLLLIQGMAAHQQLWGEPLLTALEDDFEIVTYDHRGIGASTDPVGGEFSIADLATDAVAVLDVVGWDTAHVLGISMGGMVAQELALGHPGRVRTLGLGCTYCGGPGSSLRATGPLRMMQAMGAGNVDTSMRVAYEANLSPGFRADAAHFDPFVSAALSVPVPVDVVLHQAKAAFAHDTSARLPQLDVPTLVLHGRADEMLEYGNGELIAGLVPGAELATFDDVGHLFWWEQPARTVELLRRHCLR